MTSLLNEELEYMQVTIDENFLANAVTAQLQLVGELKNNIFLGIVNVEYDETTGLFLLTVIPKEEKVN